jgi:hypothetical protein
MATIIATILTVRLICAWAFGAVALVSEGGLPGIAELLRSSQHRVWLTALQSLLT